MCKQTGQLPGALLVTHKFRKKLMPSAASETTRTDRDTEGSVVRVKSFDSKTTDVLGWLYLER